MSKNQREVSQPTQKKPVYVSAKIKIGVAFIAITIAISYLAISSFGAATTQYVSVQEALDESKSENNKSLGVIGKLVPDTFHRSPDGLTAYFSITDETSSNNMSVSYSGEIGEIFFNQNAEIIIQGHIEKDGLFKTTSLSIKCPSKYVDQYEEESDI